MNPAASERLIYEIERLSKEIPPCMGSVEHTSDTQLVFIIQKTGDLELLGSKNARFAVTLPSGWPASPPRVTFISGKAPPGSLALAPNQPVSRVSLLDENEGWSRMYPLGVVYHSLRNLFKEPGSLVTPWDAEKTTWLPAPITLPTSGAGFGFVVSEAGGQGRRRTMEDRCLLRQGVSVPKQYTNYCALFGIFDGHAGDACAEFAEREVPLALLDCLATRKGCGWREALNTAFRTVDDKFLADPALAHTGAGCTACVVLFDGRDKLVCANLGDCRAVLCGEAPRSGSSASSSPSSSFVARDLTFDCRADRPDEVARIVQRGGFVNNKRVNGQLAVSRALGDGDFKRPPDPLVTNCPEITETRLQPGDEFLLIACDGLWDVMTSEEAGLFVRERLLAAAAAAAGSTDTSAVGAGGGRRRSSSSCASVGPGRAGDEPLLEKVAAELVRHAIEDRRSTDNVSVVLARLVPEQQDGGRHGKHPHPPLTSADKVAEESSSRSGSVRQPLQERRPPAGLASLAAPQRNLLGFSSDSPEPSPMATSKPVAAGAAAAVVVPKKSKDKSLDTDEDLMEFLLDDANFK